MTQETKEEWEARTREKLNKLDATIASLKAHAADSSEKASEKQEQIMKDVHEKKASLEQKLEKLRDDGEMSWERVQSEISSGLDDVTSAISGAKEALKDRTS